MNIKFSCISKRIISLLCIVFIFLSLLPINRVNANPITIGSLALDTSVVVDATYKAEIINFAKAAGYEANAQYIKTSILSNLCKAVTRCLGSAVIAAIQGFAMGMESAYNDMDLNFKQQFTYEECLQYVWKKAMGEDDKELLVFLHTALNPDNVQGIADGTKAFEYNLALSKALNYAVYDGFFEAIPTAKKLY